MNEKLMLAVTQAKMAADEATTIAQYTENLAALDAAGETDRAAQLREVLSDELNHIARFVEGYVALTGIEISED